MKTSKIISSVALTIVVVTSGCAFGTGKKISTKNVETIQRGVTTKAEVIQKFGVPHSMARTHDGKQILHYMHMQSSQSPLSFVPIFGISAIAGGGKASNQNLMVTLDASGVVENFSYTGSEIETGGGIVAPHDKSRSLVNIDEKGTERIEK